MLRRNRFLLVLLLLAAVPGTGAPSAPAYLEAPSIAPYDILSSGFTVEFWIKVNSKPGFDPRIIHCASTVPESDAGSGQWDLLICNLSDCSPGTVLFEVWSHGESRYIASTLRVDDGTFHHVAGTYDGTALRLFVDGKAQAEMPLADLEVRVEGGRLVVGNAFDHNNAFDGVVDEIRIWNTARTRDQIRAAMNTEVKKVPAGLTGYWPLDGDGSDRSGNGNALVPHNIVVFRDGRLGKAAVVVNSDPLKG